MLQLRLMLKTSAGPLYAVERLGLREDDDNLPEINAGGHAGFVCSPRPINSRRAKRSKHNSDLVLNPKH